MTIPENNPPTPRPPITEPKSALEKSIAHWERLATGKRGYGEAPTGGNCALCAAYENCKICPVSAATGLGQCQGTPYIAARREWNLTGPDSPEFRAAAQKELDFLESLRPTSDGISNQKDDE